MSAARSRRRSQSGETQSEESAQVDASLAEQSEYANTGLATKDYAGTNLGGAEAAESREHDVRAGLIERRLSRNGETIGVDLSTPRRADVVRRGSADRHEGLNEGSVTVKPRKTQTIVYRGVKYRLYRGIDNEIPVGLAQVIGESASRGEGEADPDNAGAPRPGLIPVSDPRHEPALDSEIEAANEAAGRTNEQITDAAESDEGDNGEGDE